MLKSMRLNHLEYSLIIRMFPPDYNWETVLAAAVQYTLPNIKYLAVKSRHNDWIESLPQLRLINKDLKWELKGFINKQWTLTPQTYEQLLDVGRMLSFQYDTETISVCLQNYAHYLLRTGDMKLLDSYEERKHNANGPQSEGVKITLPQEVLGKLIIHASSKGIHWRKLVREVILDYVEKACNDT